MSSNFIRIKKVKLTKMYKDGEIALFKIPSLPPRRESAASRLGDKLSPWIVYKRPSRQGVSQVRVKLRKQMLSIPGCSI